MIDSDDITSVLAPIAITDAVITSTNIAVEDPNSLWASGTTYTQGQRVYLATTHRVYEATAKASNLGKDPSVPTNQFDAAGAATYWIDAGPTNRTAMFDGYASTQTTNAGSISLVIKPGYFNAISLLNIDGDTLVLTVRDAPGGNIIYNYSGALEGSAPADYYEYFFDSFKPQTRFNAFDISPYSNAEITLTVTKVSGIAKIGMMAIGDLRPLGAPLRGASVEPLDFSYRSTDAFGVTTLKKRGSATGLSISAKMSIEDANSVLDAVQQLLSVPVVVVGSQVAMYEALTVFGTMSARITFDDYGEPVAVITVQGLL